MLNSLIGAAVSALTAAGINAGSAYPAEDAGASAGYVRVGLKELRASEGAALRYLGLTESAEHGQTELYGLPCRVELRLDIYTALSGTDAPGDCIDLMEQAVGCIGSGVTGLTLRGLHCGGPEPDRRCGMLHLSGSVTADAILTVPPETAEISFTDYILRGELRSNEQL